MLEMRHAVMAFRRAMPRPVRIARYCKNRSVVTTTGTMTARFFKVMWLCAAIAAFALAGNKASAEELPKTAADLGLMQGFPPPKDAQVTRANWLAPPFNRWAFQHADRLFPAHVFRRDMSVAPLPLGPVMDIGSIQVADVDGSKMPLSTLLEKYYSDGLLVLHKGRIVHEQYWNGMTPQTPHMLFSVSKSLTGALVYQLVERGLLDLDGKVADHVPELAESAFGDATIQQMMDMEVATFWDESPKAIADPESAFSKYAASVGFIHSPELATAYDSLRAPQKTGEHGKVFNYVAPATDALGWVIERVTGRSYGENLDMEILSKIGLEGRGFVLVDPHGKGLATGGINLTLRDMARFGMMIAQGGWFGGERIVSQSYIDDSRKNGDREAFAKGGKVGAFLPGGAYRNLWWVTPGEPSRLMGLGVYGQNLYINPEAEVVIARFASLPTSFGAEDPIIWKIYDQISSRLMARN